jgi:isocitrate dehydrogenase (NAD+)
LPQKTLDSIRRTGLALKGPTTTPVGGGHASINVALRKTLDLYANVRPIKTLPGVKSRYDHVDLVIVRENTEDLYSGLEHVVVPGVVESIKVITEKASTRIAKFAFNYARTHGRKRITAVHKANIMKLSDGLFLDCCAKVAKDFPEIKYDDIIVDNCCMQLVLDPTRFDMLLLENLYGDIVSDLCAGLIGGLGLAPGANIGEKGATFEAVHGSAPDIAGKNVANPIALILSGALLLDHIGELEAGNKVRHAVTAVLKEGKHMPRDLGGSASTSEVEEAIATRILRSKS